LKTADQKTLDAVLKLYSHKEVAAHLQVDPKTVSRWSKGEGRFKPAYARMIESLGKTGKAPTVPVRTGFTFIDLFAGIGGFRLALERSGGKCLFTSEYDSYCEKTYRANFSVAGHLFRQDIREVPADDIPAHDVLAAGFPCQPFSIAGVSKKRSLGQPDGFACNTQGTLFFDVARIIDSHRPAAFILENVKNLRSHDAGNTLRIILDTLEQGLGYQVFSKIIDAKGFVPQHRERIFIVGFREPTSFSWDDLRLPARDTMSLSSILHPQDGSEPIEEPFTTGKKAKVNEKYILSEKLWTYLQNYAQKHREKGNGFGFGLVRKNDTSRTLSARYYKDGSEILVSRGRGRPRRLTPRECSRLMGFDEPGRPLQIPVSDTRAYKQFGNAVVPKVVDEVFRIMKPHLMQIRDKNSLNVDPLQRDIGFSNRD
jgi:DNA (cytosine-5)-methyltransferase 1